MFEIIMDLNFNSLLTMCDIEWHSKLRFRRTAFYRRVSWDKAGYHTILNTHCIVYWYIEGNSNLHKGHIIVPVAGIENFMCDYTCSIMISSIKSGVIGARPHRNGVNISPAHTKILIFMLCVQLIEFNITYSIGSVAMNILYAYKHSVINEVWNLL